MSSASEITATLSEEPEASRLSFLSVLTLSTAFVVFLFATRPEILSFPPYWDYLVGVWSEAIYLAHHNFDYVGLIDKEPFVGHGGHKAYVTTFIPTLYALLIRFLDNPVWAFRLSHFFQWCVGGVLFSLLTATAKRRFPLSISLLFASAVMMTPSVSASLDMYGMELGVAAANMLVIAMLESGRPGLATLAGVATLSFKPTGLITAGLLVLFFLKDMFVFLASRQLRSFVIRLVLVLVLLGFVFANIYLFRRARLHESQLSQFGEAALISLLLGSITTPDVFLLWMAAVISSSYLGVKYALRTNLPHNLLARLNELLREKRYATLFTYASMLLYGLSFATVIFHPRYSVVVTPLIHSMFSRLIPRRRCFVLTYTILLLINILNQSGAFFIQLNSFEAFAPGRRNGSLLERSREYIPYLKADQRLSEYLERNHRDTPIVATFELGSGLMWPEEGYVKTPLQVYRFLDDFSWGAFEADLAALLKTRPQELLMIPSPMMDFSSIIPADAEVVYHPTTPSPDWTVFKVVLPKSPDMQHRFFVKILADFFRQKGLAGDDLKNRCLEFARSHSLADLEPEIVAQCDALQK